MKIKIFNFLFWSAVSLIIFWFVFPIFCWIFNLEFASNELEIGYGHFMFYALPISIILTLTKTLNNNKIKTDNLGIVIGTLILASISVMVAFFSVFSTMCSWSNGQVLYKLKDNAKIVIMERNFGCGASDSTEPMFEIHRVRSFTKFFIHASKVDTATINKNDWIEIK